MNILIAGGAGFIGSNLIVFLMNKHPDWKIFCVDKLTYAGNLANLKDVMDNPNFKFFKIDISDRQKMHDFFNLNAIDKVINLVAESHVDRSIEDSSIFIKTNILGTQTLMDMCREFNVKRYHQVSTDEVYGDLPLDRLDLLDTELSPLKASNPYAASKAAADLFVLSYVRTYNFPATISRCTNNYGGHQYYEKLIPVVISKAFNNEKIPIYGKGLNVRDWIYVEDHCRAIELILEKGKVGEVYNVAGNNELNNISIVKKILNIMNKPLDLISFVADRKGHDLRYALDVTKINNELGWFPLKKFDDGIKETVKWYLDNPDWLLPKQQ